VINSLCVEKLAAQVTTRPGDKQLIPWGDIGPTVILMAGIVAIAKRNAHLSQASWLTFVMLCGYLVARGLMRGALTV